MSKVAIIGGHGKVALHLASQLTERGDAVTALFRNPEHEADVTATGAAPVVLDVEHADTAAIAAALAGHDAVVWTAGAGGGDPERTVAVDREAAIRSMEAAAQAGVYRYVMISFRGAGRVEVPEDEPFYAYAEAKAAADAHLRSSGLQWTILGPGALDLEPAAGTIRVDTDGDPALGKISVSREDVAAVTAGVLADETTIGRTIEFVGGGQPIAEALQQG